MDTMLVGRLLSEPIAGNTVFMVHLHDQRQYWEARLGGRIPVRTSYSLGFGAIRKFFQIPAIGVNQLKIAYMLDELVPDEPKTDEDRAMVLKLLNRVLQQASDAPSDAQVELRQPGYRSIVITLAALAKKEACRPDDDQAIEEVLDRFTPWYKIFRSELPSLDRKRVIALVEQVLRRSLPIDGTLAEYDFADQVWLPAIFDAVQLEPIDTLLIDKKPGFYRAERIMVEQWQRGGTRVVEVVADFPGRP